VIETLGEVVKGSTVRSSSPQARAWFARRAAASRSKPIPISHRTIRARSTEEASDALIDSGAHVIVVRFPQVHDTQKQGRISLHVELARRKLGRVHR